MEDDLAKRGLRLYLWEDLSKPWCGCLNSPKDSYAFKNTGSVHKHPYPTDKAVRKLTPTAQLFLLNLVVQNQGIYLHEI